MKPFLLVWMLGLACLPACIAQDLTLDAAVSRVGTLQLYLTNTGNTRLTVITAGLSQSTAGGAQVRLELEPPVMLKPGPERTLLKQSLAPYWPVILKPGETTFITHSIAAHGYAPNVRTLSIDYRVPEAWANLHGTWGGRLTVTDLPIQNGSLQQP